MKIICFLHGTKQQPDFIELKVPRRILNSPDIVAAVDRHKLSSNAFNDVFASIVRSSGGNNDFVLSTSTSNRTIKKVRTKMFNAVKKTFEAFVKDEFVSIHWNIKLIQKGRDFTAFEHIAVLLSHCNGTKLLENFQKSS